MRRREEEEEEGEGGGGGRGGNALFNNARNTFHIWLYGGRERNVLFNDALNTFYLRLYGVRHMVKDHSDSGKGKPLPPHGLLLSIKQGFFYMHHPTDRITHTTAFVTPVVGYMVSDTVKGLLSEREETCCCHCGLLFLLAARVLLYAPSHRQDSTYNSLCYTSRGVLGGTGNSSMSPP